MKIIPKPWGRERIIEANDKYAFKILEVDPRQRLSLQYHEQKRETMYCIYGCGTLFLSNDQGTREMTLLPGRLEDDYSRGTEKDYLDPFDNGN
jgi:mannose-6-phosphate isomerase-like protein (cupin superfamily)